MNNRPTVMIVLGATGDLMARKIIPAVYQLYMTGELPKFFRVIGFSRREWGDQELREKVKEDLPGKNIPEEFLNMFTYCRGNFELPDGYWRMREMLEKFDQTWEQKANRLFYLAVPPEYYQSILGHLANSELAKNDNEADHWDRIVVEKPFGKDQQTAEELDVRLGKLFAEEQIYRIDHYLAKEMVQNVLAFRFANRIFEDSWNKDGVEKIEVRLWESLGAEGRGKFFDGVGMLRDMGQNHLLQMLALVTMKRPTILSAKEVRHRRAEILGRLVKPEVEEVEKNTYRAQYGGYRDITGVEPNSQTETYFKVMAFMDTPQWRGVPLILEAGKAMAQTKKEIIVTFRHPKPGLGSKKDMEHRHNRVIFSLEPEEQIVIEFWAKKPGHEFEIEQRELKFSLRELGENKDQIDEYAILLADCLKGDQMLFAGTAEIAAMWKFIDGITDVWHDQPDKSPLGVYDKGTNPAVNK